MKQMPVTILYKVVKNEEGKLTLDYKRPMDQFKHDLFMKSVKEGDTIEITHEHWSTDHSYSQLSKVHACIRALAKELGYSFDDVKSLVKEKAGYPAVDGNYKSFADSSKEELSMAIQAAIEIGNQVGISLE